MHFDSRTVILALFSILLVASLGAAQEAEHEEHGTPPEHEVHGEDHAEETENEEHGEEHGERPHHLNDFSIFLGATDEHGHETELTWGLDYRRVIAHRWAVGALFDYAGGDLRNAIFAASITWFPVGRLQLTAAPGIEFHRARGSTDDCGCGGALKSEDPDQTDHFDEDARYFLFRLGAGWHFPVGRAYGIVPNVNVDFVDGEKVLVYGVNFAFAW